MKKSQLMEPLKRENKLTIMTMTITDINGLSKLQTLMKLRPFLLHRNGTSLKRVKFLQLRSFFLLKGTINLVEWLFFRKGIWYRMMVTLGRGVHYWAGAGGVAWCSAWHKTNCRSYALSLPGQDERRTGGQHNKRTWRLSGLSRFSVTGNILLPVWISHAVLFFI